MRTSPDLERLADHLGVRIAGPLAGGEFGALLAVDAHGRELVLKTMSIPEFFSPEQLADWFARGTRLSGRLRERGYPAPRYIGTGALGRLTWSLQERMPGAVPDVMTDSHARRLVRLVGMHRDAAEESYAWKQWALRRIGENIEAIVTNEHARALADELSTVVDRTAGVELRESDVVHSDFHHRNYLAVGDDVMAVFDWELAMPGDWRVDLVTLAFWSAIQPAVPPSAARIVLDAMFASCRSDELAFLAAFQTLRQLDYDVREHPERLPGLVAAVETAVAPWWREA